MKKIMIATGIVVVLVIAFALFQMTGNDTTEDIPGVIEDEIIEDVDIIDDMPDEIDNALEDRDPDHVLTLTGSSGFTFVMNGEVNPDIVVSEGDLVRIEFSNVDGMPHDWVLDEFNAATDIINDGESDVIEFVASESGEFEYYCSVGQHRQQGMFGKFIVE